jgi:CheY-like chemotaxis protein
MSAEEEKARILIVEDEVLIAADLEGRLTGLGYTVCGKATSGKEALDLAEQHCPTWSLWTSSSRGKWTGPRRPR